MLDEAVLALLYYNDCNSGSAWKSFPWAATDRPYKAKLISNPAKARKSVDLHKHGFEKGNAAFERLFVRKAG